MSALRARFEWSWTRGFAGAFKIEWLSAVCVCLIGILPAAGQVTGQVPDPSVASPRLLSPEEGHLIVNVAWQEEQMQAGMRDCSHFVHQIYTNAGFEYAYVSSYEIYAGNGNFERVKYPHPGDLIAWPGHVGIVADPLEHTFYSLVRTGWETQNYRSAYWRSRGIPRFYRYKVGSGSTRSTADDAPSFGTSNRDRARTAATNAGLMIEERPTAEYDSPNRPPAPVSEKSQVIYGPPVPSAPSASDTVDVGTAVPPSVIISTGGKIPTREEVAAGISELSDANGSALRTGDPLKSQLPVVIVEQFQVEHVDVKRGHGWARLAVDSKVMIGGGATQVKRRHEKVRWELQRTESGWQAVAPQDRTYVPHDAAVKHLAEQLALLTRSDEATRHQPGILVEEAELASILNVLLENK